MKKLKTLTLISVFGLTLVAALAPGSAHSETIEYVPGITPRFLTESNPIGYGGPSGVLKDGFFDGYNQVYTVKVLYPKAISAEDRGGLFHDHPMAPERRYLVDEAPVCTTQDETYDTCEYSVGFSEYSDIWRAVVWPESVFNFFVEYTNSEGVTSLVQNVTTSGPTDSLEWTIIGSPYDPAGGLFGNPEKTLVTDPTVQTHVVSVLTRNDVNIKHVMIDLGVETVFVEDFEVVNDPRFFGGKAREYQYSWDIGSLGEGEYPIYARLVSDNGNEAEVAFEGRYSAGAKLFIDVDHNQKLLKQCQDASDAISLLFADINKDVSDRQVRLEALYLTVREQAGLFEDIDTDSKTSDLQAAFIDYRNTISTLDGLQDAKCVTTVSNLVKGYREAYSNYRESMRGAANQLKALINVTLEHQESKDTQ